LPLPKTKDSARIWGDVETGVLGLERAKTPKILFFKTIPKFIGGFLKFGGFQDCCRRKFPFLGTNLEGYPMEVFPRVTSRVILGKFSQIWALVPKPKPSV